MLKNETITITVIHLAVQPEQNIHQQLQVQAGSSVRQALTQLNLAALIPNLDWQTIKVGIFGQLCELSTILQENDRIEIYRPLKADPKEIRKMRAQTK